MTDLHNYQYKGMDEQTSVSEQNLESEQEDTADHVINENNTVNDDLEQIDLVQCFRLMGKFWILGVLLIILGAVIMGFLFSAETTVTLGAKATIFIPPYVSKVVDGQIVSVDNNLKQISNAVGLMSSRICQEEIAKQLGKTEIPEDLFYSLTQQDSTEMIFVETEAPTEEEALLLCEAVIDVFENDACKTVAIKDLILVDPVMPVEIETTNSVFKAMAKGALGGAAVYVFIIGVMYISDHRLHNRQEAEDFLNIPVLVVLPDTGKSGNE